MVKRVRFINSIVHLQYRYSFIPDRLLRLSNKIINIEISICKLQFQLEIVVFFVVVFYSVESTGLLIFICFKTVLHSSPES